MRLAEITAFFGSNNPFTTGISSAGFELTAILQTVLSSVFGMGELLMYLIFIGVATFLWYLKSRTFPAGSRGFLATIRKNFPRSPA